ncbi:HLH transcription factor [Akanthomyces lecanii RCEF 1005]|uniref:HLH transcription factor n=1 Tax=Akanthomyces lecanii RCEF 1005 TaxID=1081108 RepID=A0A167PQN9_CORDF|nr:HLH transcription factor [Akanthomyces lecanii RCEF 1005]
MYSTTQLGQKGLTPSYTAMSCSENAFNTLPMTLLDPRGTPDITIMQSPYDIQSIYYSMSLKNQNYDSNSCISQKSTGPSDVNQNATVYPSQPDSLLNPDAAIGNRQAKPAGGCLPSNLRHQTSVDFKEDMLRNRQINDNENTFMEWVYPPERGSPSRTFAGDAVQWGSDAMFDTEARSPRRRVGVRQLTQFRLQFMPDEEEDEEEEEEEDEEDDEEEQDADADDAQSTGSRSSPARSPASSVGKGPIGRSRRNVPKKAYTESSAASAARPSISEREPKGQRKKLTIEQKRSNHIRHEKKRRGLIRDGFNDLTELVPELRGGTSSKSKILFKVADLLKTLLEEKEALQEQLGGLEASEQGLCHRCCHVAQGN